MNEVIPRKEVERIEFMNNEYGAARDDAKSALTHYMKIGQSLIEQQKDYYKSTGTQKGFDQWIDRNCDFGLRSAYNYMDLGKSCNALQDYLKNAENPSLRDALRYIKPVKLPAPTKEKPSNIHEVCSEVIKEYVSITNPNNQLAKKTKEIIEFQDQADESDLWKLKKSLRATAQKLMELADSLDVTDETFKERIAANEKVIDMWTGEAS